MPATDVLQTSALFGIVMFFSDVTYAQDGRPDAAPPVIQGEAAAAKQAIA